jgi:hypothetical protein
MTGYYLLLLGTFIGCTTDNKPDENTDTNLLDSASDSGSNPIEDCLDSIEEPLSWFEETQVENLEGILEFGQTHVTLEDETRISARLIAQRATLILFSPENQPEEDTDIRIGAWSNGELLGVLPMSPPSILPQSLEVENTEVELEPYSQSAWSVRVPHTWFDEGNKLMIGFQDDGVLYQKEKTIEGLGSPHRFTITRSKILMWGDGDKDVATMSGTKLLYDYFPTIPAAELRLVDSLPWKVPEFVVRTAQGPLLVSSEEERLAVTDQDHHWALFKHQFTLRHSLANTGRGLVMTGDSEGDSSPYSFGTSLHMGWFQRPDGAWQDIDDAPWAAGWTGWTAMWVNECGNGFIHEFGHSMTMLHFTEGTANDWGIGEEYPQDGVNLETHPWGYDTLRNRFRTWYRVDANGPVVDENGALVGKRDPMNGGESADAGSCFPQYTNYHARKAQEFFQDNKTIMDGSQGVGVYQWDLESLDYVLSSPEESHQTPLLIDVPVVTIIGTLAQTDPETQIYPAIHAISGNVFSVPDPSDGNLPSEYHGGQYVLEVEYEDSVVDRAMIARSVISDTSLGLFSMNLEASRKPVEARLYRSDDSAYPTLDENDLQLVYSRAISIPDDYPEVLRIGKGRNANAELLLEQRCDPDLNCVDRRVESVWDLASEPLRFVDQQGQTAAPSVCGEEDDVTTLQIPVINENGQTGQVIVHAQRIIRNGQNEKVFPINDETPWLSSADVQQGIRIWLPWNENAELGEGIWQTDGDFILEGYTQSGLYSQTPIEIALEVKSRSSVDLSVEYKSPGLETPNSSMYFLAVDDAIGPTSRIWWGNWDGWTELQVPVINTETREPTTLHLLAQQEELGSRWEMHAGRSAGDNQHHLVLQVDYSANDHLVIGQTYVTPDSAPLIIEGRRWHDPEGQKLIDSFVLDVQYTP